jgi:hypothetical protein
MKIYDGAVLCESGFARKFRGGVGESRSCFGNITRQSSLDLTLIRAAGGVYDYRNFEEVYLCNGLSSELENSCIPQKTSRE